MTGNSKNHFSLLEYDTLKLLNKHDKVSSILEVRDGRRTFDPLWPISVELHLTDICNLKCYWCTDNDLKDNKSFLEFEIAKRLCMEFKAHGVGVTLEGGGEPTMHKHFADIVRYAGSIGLDLGLITNGTNDIKDLAEYFKWIRVSIDSTNSEEYKREKGRDLFNDVMNNLQELNESRDSSKTLLGVGYVITKDNTEHILEFIERLERIGIDYIYLRPVEEYHESSPDFEELYKLHRYFVKNEEKYRIKVLLKIDERAVRDNDSLPCIAHSLTSVVRANGAVVMCEKRRHDINIFGNVNDASFNDIWLSEDRKAISRALMEPDHNKGCEVCRLTRFNRMLYDLSQLKTMNFI